MIVMGGIIGSGIFINPYVVAPYVRGYRKNAHYFLTPWQYLDIDTAVKATRR